MEVALNFSIRAGSCEGLVASDNISHQTVAVRRDSLLFCYKVGLNLETFRRSAIGELVKPTETSSAPSPNLRSNRFRDNVGKFCQSLKSTKTCVVGVA